MIKINLVPKEKKNALQSLLVFISKINVGMFVLSVLIFYGSKGALALYSKFYIDNKNEQIQELRNDLKILKQKSRKNKDIKQRIDNVKNQKQQLQERKKLVEERTRNKKNPFSIMKYISNDIPKDAWLKKIEIKEDQINLDGVTLTYKSIGTFMERLKESTYFDDSLNLEASKTVVDEGTGRRTEEFNISGKIVQYN